ncbi:phosphotransferase [Marinomonas profundimaris]|uniref:Phosphotransferase n=1 Tax=Marinomonas profundimaris TaxID=1208321 RepID=W1S2C0_9GAMM|nr:phosphotransferase [Marinomonas profundimaris]
MLLVLGEVFSSNVGFWLLAFGFWLLAFGFWVLGVRTS